MTQHAHDFTEIPTLDLSLANDPSTSGKKQLLAQLRHALTNVGFLYIINHGVPDAVISNLTGTLSHLFSLPLKAKEEIALRNSPHFLGYSQVGSETTAGKADSKEQFEFATELDETWSEGGAKPLYERLRGPNQWPSAYPSVRPAVEAYIDELTLLGERFLRLVAEALSLPPDAFFRFLSDQHRLKLVRYPPVTKASDSTVQGVGPHKDSSGWWTFILQASPPHIGGLQALNKHGAWIDVPVVPGSLVVNIGQAFEVVTNGVCKATTHRVLLTEPYERFSVPFFQGVRRDLTRAEAIGSLKDHFDQPEWLHTGAISSEEAREGKDIDSPFLKGKYDTWGESQLRIRIRSQRDVGQRYYADVFDKYVCDD
ncbi:oxidoreductase [Bombardia bombarda]|uniref:Oxidoreductase n=1 Tax=Bombardia bombarda TaxID=252184 RepID=A0AA40C8J7_9PEZI|nr:oxidoreductase [Bombardia bombarda]